METSFTVADLMSALISITDLTILLVLHLYFPYTLPHSHTRCLHHLSFDIGLEHFLPSTITTFLLFIACTLFQVSSDTIAGKLPLTYSYWLTSRTVTLFMSQKVFRIGFIVTDITGIGLII